MLTRPPCCQTCFTGSVGHQLAPFLLAATTAPASLDARLRHLEAWAESSRGEMDGLADHVDTNFRRVSKGSQLGLLTGLKCKLNCFPNTLLGPHAQQQLGCRDGQADNQ